MSEVVAILARRRRMMQAWEKHPMSTLDEKVPIEITRAEALVLFEWLKSTDGRLPVAHPAEQTVLWRIEAVLERLLPPNYNAIVGAARSQIADSEKPSPE